MLDCTVIIPTYNDKNIINRAVNSVLNQTKIPQKIIIIDDASNDGISQDILLDLNTNPIIDVIFLKENMGPGSARNVGMEKASTKYIAFLDADDSWHPKKLEIQISIMENRNYYLTCHDCSLLKKNIEYPPIDNNVRVKNISKRRLFLKNYVQTRSVIMRNEKRFSFKEKKRYAEDYLLWLTLSVNGESIGLIKEDLGYYHKEDFTAGLSSKMEQMARGEIENAFILYKQGYLNSLNKNLLQVYYVLKYVRRKAIFLMNK